MNVPSVAAPAARAGAPSHAEGGATQDTDMGKFAMWVFLASEAMFFTGLIGAYIVLRAGAAEWPDPAEVLDVPLTLINTFILIGSSVTMVKALYAIQGGDRKGLRNNLVATIVLGSIFLGIQAYEWNHLLGHVMQPGDDLMADTFYTLTGFHGMHVLAGVITLVVLLFKTLGGSYGEGDYGGVEFAGLYWHFVDLVWIILFTIVYLI